MNSNQTINLQNTYVFQHYYINMYPGLRYFVYGYVNDLEAANDLVQDIWLKMWEQKMTFPNETAMKAFIYRSLRNSSLNYLRTQAHEQERYQQFSESNEEEDTILNKIIEAEVYSMLNEAFSELTNASKRAYIESLKGKSQKEIAEIMNISVNTVKRHINNANHYLRKRLEKLLVLFLLG